MEREKIWFTIRENGQTKRGDPLFEIFTDHPVAEGESVIDVRSCYVPYKMAELTLMFEAMGYDVFFNATDK